MAAPFLLAPLLRDRPERLAYLGWLGHHNLGDEILLAAIQGLLPGRDLRGRPRSGWLDRRERAGRRPYGGVMLGGGTLVYRSRVALETLEHYADLGRAMVAFGPGVYDTRFPHDHRNPEWRASVPRWNAVLERMAVLGVRGPHSLATLEAQGVTGAEIVGDPALALAPERWERKRGVRRVGVNFGLSRGDVWGHEDVLTAAVEGLVRRLARGGDEVVLLPVWHKDRKANRVLLKRLRGLPVRLEDHVDDFPRWREAVAACDAFVGVKLHAVLVAHLTRTPALMLAYQPKCEDYMASMGAEDAVVRTDRLEPHELAARVDALRSEAPAWQARLDERVRHWQGRLRAHADRVGEALAAGGR